MRQIAILLIGLVFFPLTGCQLSPVRYDQQREGFWQAKALLRDRKAERSAVVGLDINAVQNQKLRVDVTAALGHPVASMVLDGDKLTYVLLENRQSYQGPATGAALKAIFSVPMEPRYLFALLFDTPIEDKNWTCSKDARGFLEECKNLASNVQLRWADRKGRRKTVFVDHPSGTVQMNFNSFQPKVEGRKGLFTLQIPQGFKSLR